MSTSVDQAQGDTYPFPHEKDKREVRILSNGKEGKGMVKKVNCNIIPFIHLSPRLTMNHLLTSIHPWWALEVPGFHC